MTNAVVATTLFCTAVYGQQGPQIFGVVHQPEGKPVPHVEVRIEKGGAIQTSDSGEFALAMPPYLKVGLPAVFTVTNYVIVVPCELKRGRTYLRDPSAEPIDFLVLPLGDRRLKATDANAKADPVFRILLKCVLEEGASQFSPEPKPGPRSSLPNEQHPFFAAQVEKTYPGTELTPDTRASCCYLIGAAYHPPGSQSLSEPPPEEPNEAANASGGEFLARKAKELGFTVEELKSAIDVWAESAEDPYEKGLAALHELRYAEASQYISASIASPPGAFVERYVPLARAEYELGHYRAAELALRKVLAVHSDDPVVLNNLAMALKAQAKYSEAEPLYKRSLAINEETLGPDDPEVSTVVNNLGVLYKTLGKYSEAELLYKRALAIDEKVLGPDNPDIAVRLNNLGVLYKTEGKYKEAEPLYKRALAIDEKVLGPDHPEVAVRLNNLGVLYKTQGKYNEAEPLYNRALAIDEKVLGPNHPTVAIRLNNLAELYRAQGKYNEAELLYKRALAIDEKVLGPDHPDVAVRLNNLGLLYKTQRKYGEAEPLYKRALAIDEKVLGPDHPDVAIRLNNLGMLYYAEGKYGDAEALLRRSLVIREKALGPDHPSVATTDDNLAHTLRKLGRDSEAEAYEQQAATIRAKNNQ